MKGGGGMKGANDRGKFKGEGRILWKSMTGWKKGEVGN